MSKIRTSFVTNSSSSSFVVAYKTHKAIDKETLGKYPFLKNYDALLEKILLTDGYNETTEGEIIRTKEEYDEYFVERYGWGRYNTIEKICEDDEYYTNMYNRVVEHLEKGFNILYKNVDYCDGYCAEMIRGLESEDFIILEDE